MPGQLGLIGLDQAGQLVWAVDIADREAYRGREVLGAAPGCPLVAAIGLPYLPLGIARTERFVLHVHGLSPHRTLAAVTGKSCPWRYRQIRSRDPVPSRGKCLGSGDLGGCGSAGAEAMMAIPPGPKPGRPH